MNYGIGEKRRRRRVALPVAVIIRKRVERQPLHQEHATAVDVSLAGVCFETQNAQAYAVNDWVTASVMIPESKATQFPFRRLAGRGRVVRISKSNVALEFGNDLLALTAQPAG